jgi:hypothetical protein
MRDYMKNRVAEAREALDPVLKELDLTLKVAESRYETTIYFRGSLQPGMVDWPRSPILINFRWEPDGRANPEAKWSDGRIEIQDWRPKPLGGTGWFHRRWWDSKVLGIEKTDNAMFTWIGNMIRRKGVFTPSGQPNMVDSEKLADAYWAIGRRIRDLGIVELDSEIGPREALTFQDHLGRRIHMIFHGGTTLLMIDGEAVGRFDDRALSAAVLAEHLKTGRFSAAHDITPIKPGSFIG